MSLELDALLDRRRLKRQLIIWRVIAVLALTAAVVVAVGRVTGGFALKRDHIARFDVSGIIIQDSARDTALAAIASDGSAKALLLHVNSPGGTVVGGEDLYTALREVAEAKPVVAVLGTLATSAGYMTAVAADRIYAREGTITGSIGVVFQATEFSELMQRLGIRAEAIKSGPLKAQPSPLEPMTEEARVATRALVMDIHRFFVDLVAQRRGFDAGTAQGLADGRVFTGRQAVDTGLIDAIGGEDAAVAWLAEAHGLDPDLPVREVRVRSDDQLWRNLLSSLTGKTLYSEALTLDGLVSLWHPQLN